MTGIIICMFFAEVGVNRWWQHLYRYNPLNKHVFCFGSLLMMNSQDKNKRICFTFSQVWFSLEHLLDRVEISHTLITRKTNLFFFVLMQGKVYKQLSEQWSLLHVYSLTFSKWTTIIESNCLHHLYINCGKR